MDSTVPYGYVYRITNQVNGKTYIGKRALCYDKSWRHYMGSGILVKQAIEKYGVENFIKALVEFCPTKQALSDREEQVIARERSLGRGQYNLYGGSCGGDFSSDLPFEKKLEIRRKFDKWLQETRGNPNYKHPNLIKSEKEWSNFVENYSSQISITYGRLKSIKKTSEELSLPVKKVSRYIHESGAPVYLRTKKGVARPECEKIALQASMKRWNEKNLVWLSVSRRCNWCHQFFETRFNTNTLLFRSNCCSLKCSQKNLGIVAKISKEMIEDLYITQDLSVSQIAVKLGCKKSSVYGLLQKYNISTKHCPSLNVRN